MSWLSEWWHRNSPAAKRTAKIVAQLASEVSQAVIGKILAEPDKYRSDEERRKLVVLTVNLWVSKNYPDYTYLVIPVISLVVETIREALRAPTERL